MKSSCTVKQCSVCKKCEHNESKCFQKSKLDKKSENRTNFREVVKFLSIVVVTVRKKIDFGFCLYVTYIL